MSLQTDDFSAPTAGRTRAVLAATATPAEEALERALRPKQLAEYVGQVKAREQLEIFIGAARKRGEALRSEERRVGKECRSRGSPDH